MQVNHANPQQRYNPGDEPASSNAANSDKPANSNAPPPSGRAPAPGPQAPAETRDPAQPKAADQTPATAARTPSSGQRPSPSLGSPATPPAAPDTGPTQTFTIFGKDTASQPDPNYSVQQREQFADHYADRVKTQMGNIESGTEAEKNLKYLNARPFMTPSGYFSGGLMAAGYDPNQQIKATFDSYTGMGRPQSKSGSSEQSYNAWEIAAGRLEHDRPESGGMVNFQSMHLNPADEATVRNLEAVGAKLQDRWKQEVAEPMRDPSGAMAERSGKADAYSAQATLKSLQSDKAAFGRLSPEGQQAINRTLGQNGQVIIPNVYGYPMAGHAFVPYKPYDGNYENRPNQGLMLSLNQGAVSEIKGDKDFASWAKRNRDDVLQSFNDRDRQGGLDAHWPKAGDVLDNMIAENKVSYPGYKNPVSDQDIPASELFNYTRARGSDYQLKYGNLGDKDGAGVASQYQAVNAKNAAWADQTGVFGSAEKNWKDAKSIWSGSFGYLPFVGNVGTMVFGAHDSLHGMTAKDRIGGNVGATVAGLQLLHELAPAAAGAAALGKSPAVSKAAAGGSGWQYNPQTSEFRFTPPQRVNGQIGYPMSPVDPPRLGGDHAPALPAAGSDAASVHEPGEPHADASSSAAGPSGHPPASEPASAQAQARRPSQADPGELRRPSQGSASIGSAKDLEGRGTQQPSTNSSPAQTRAGDQPAAAPPGRAPSTRSSSSSYVTSPLSSPAEPGATPRRPSVQSDTSAGNPPVNPLSADEEAGFNRYFPGGVTQADTYLKGKSLGMARSPAYLASDQYTAPQSWSGLEQAERNRMMDRYLSVWDPEPKRADFSTEQEFASSRDAYNERMGKYREGGNYDMQKYWNDLIAGQNNMFKSFVDNQTKRLAVATKAYDNYTANPSQYRAKPDDPHLVRQQMRGQQDLKRDVTFLQREALDFGKNGFFKLDDRNVSQLRSNFLGLFGRDNTGIEAAFMDKKNNLENELYRYGNTTATRAMVEEKKRGLQARFNSDVDTASKNMDLIYKRIALYGTVGTLSLSALSAIVWKTIDEIRQKH